MRENNVEPDFDKGGGLLPVVTQDIKDNTVLMVAYMDKEAWEATLATGLAHYHSRSRNFLWKKGETSGHLQYICEIRLDCDQDAILIKVRQELRTACHTGERSCFFNNVPINNFPKSQQTVKDIVIYSDGGCTGNPGPGGWAAVILRDGNEPQEISGGEAQTTNNRMELQAVIEALNIVKDEDAATITIHTDSQYLKNGITQWIYNWRRNGWKTKDGKDVKNKDIWTVLNELNTALSPKWEWVKGHSGDKWNERCDVLVAKERRKR